MNPPPPTDDDRNLLPLLVLAPRPPGSEEPLAKTTHGEQTTSLFRSEFGYDCRLEGQSRVTSKQPRQISVGRSSLGWIAAAFLIVAGVVVAFQPAARDAVSGLFSKHQSAPVASPAVTGGVLAVRSTPAPLVQLTGSYLGSADGSSTTTCNLGSAKTGVCTWTITHAANKPMHFRIDWTGTATMAIAVTDQAGKPLLTKTSSSTPLEDYVSNAPQSVTITLTISLTAATTFTLVPS